MEIKIYLETVDTSVYGALRQLEHSISNLYTLTFALGACRGQVFFNRWVNTGGTNSCKIGTKNTRLVTRRALPFVLKISTWAPGQAVALKPVKPISTGNTVVPLGLAC